MWCAKLTLFLLGTGHLGSRERRGIHRLFLDNAIELKDLLGDVSENRKRSERDEVMQNGDEEATSLLLPKVGCLC